MRCDVSFIQLPIAHLCMQCLAMVSNCLFYFVVQEALEVQDEDKCAINTSPTSSISTVTNIKTDQTSKRRQRALKCKAADGWSVLVTRTIAGKKNILGYGKKICCFIMPIENEQNHDNEASLISSWFKWLFKWMKGKTDSYCCLEVIEIMLLLRIWSSLVENENTGKLKYL